MVVYAASGLESKPCWQVAVVVVMVVVAETTEPLELS
jgi:hypothetical protein